MTSVLGHLTNLIFEPGYSDWRYPKPDSLFAARVLIDIADVCMYVTHKWHCSQIFQDKKPVAKNIEMQARNARALFIWTDCDREGEHIGSEVRSAARKGNRNLEIKRAKFSNIERA
jgi:DNA topoisomerase-3